MAIARSQQKANATKGGRPDYWLSILMTSLIIVGLIMVYSASVVMSRELTGNGNYYFLSQLKSAGFGLVALIVALKIDYRFWRKVAPFLLGVNIILLIMVFIPGIGFGYGGANRWLKIGPLFLGQPSEFIKLTLIMYLSAWFENKGKDMKSFFGGTLPFLAILGLIVGLVLKQPDMGTTTVLAATAGIMFFVAGASFVHIAGMMAGGIAGVWLLIKTAPYRMARFMIFLNPSADSSGTGYHINQALLAVGSGGLLGLGFGKSRQKFNYLPEAATDSIFAVISEELGLIRASMVILLFILFAIRGYKIANDAPDTFSRLMAVGITTWIISQAFINIMAILSMIPLTGVPLPFISFGGSSLMTLMFACGILLNISKHAKEGERNASRRIGRGDWWSHLASIGSGIGA